MKERLKNRFLIRVMALFFCLGICFRDIVCADISDSDSLKKNINASKKIGLIASKVGTKDSRNNKAGSEQSKNEDSYEASDEIRMNFHDTTLSKIVYSLSKKKNKNYVPNSELDNIKVSLTMRHPLTLDKAWDVLLTLLEMYGYSMIEVDGLSRIVKKDQSKQEPLPIYSSGSGVEPEDLPESDLVVRYIYFLKNITAEMANTFLSTMLEGTVQPNRELDACVITDKCLSIKSAMRIVKELDQGGLRQAVKIIILRYADAKAVQTLFEQIIPRDDTRNVRFIGAKSNKKSTYFSADTKIIADPRNNSLILMGLEKNIDIVINFIKKSIDVSIKAAQSRLHIKELKYAKAENLQPLIKNIITPPTGVSKTKQVGEFRFFEDVLVAADSSQANEGKGGGNRLIIACNKEDWIRLEKFINAIDKPQPQVAFEVLLVDVSTQMNRELGAQFKPRKDFVIGKGVNPYFETLYASKDIDLGTPDSQTNIITTDNPVTNLTFGKLVKDPLTQIEKMTLWGIVTAILGRDNFSVITQPYLVTNNNQECLVSDVSTRQVPGAFSSKTLASSLVRLRTPQDATTLVKLTPKINLNGTIDLNIRVEISNFQTDSSSDANRNTRNLETKVAIGTGEVLILGGLTRDTAKEEIRKVPILGDIPLIGNLFKSKTRSSEKANLYVFIRPSIIKPESKGIPDDYTQMKLDYAKYQILGAETYSKEKDPIQRWFFKPSAQSSEDKINDSKVGIFRPIDDYAQGAEIPVSVDITKDPYFRTKSDAVRLENQKNGKKNPKQASMRKLRLKRRRKT